MSLEKVCYDKRKIIKVLEDLNLIVVSLDRIGVAYSELPETERYEQIKVSLADFLLEWKVFDKLANARSVLDTAFSRELGDDYMEELEREFQDLQYWSELNPSPQKKQRI